MPDIMQHITIIMIAVGLAMDAFAVSIATAIRLGCVTNRQTFRLSFHFGFFQFMMPVIGWFFGELLETYIKTYDHWVAMLLLAFIGGRMIHEAFRDHPGTDPFTDPTRGFTLIALSVATSIDALAVGLSLGVLELTIWYPSVVIGIVAAGFTITGMKIGCALGARFGRNMEIAGGLLLIAIGVKIVVEHTLLA